ncbi:MAG: hypothetical protein AB7V18_19620 [Pyrinomonadaceae bacterium]
MSNEIRVSVTDPSAAGGKQYYNVTAGATIRDVLRQHLGRDVSTAEYSIRHNFQEVTQASLTTPVQNNSHIGLTPRKVAGAR